MNSKNFNFIIISILIIVMMGCEIRENPFFEVNNEKMIKKIDKNEFKLRVDTGGHTIIDIRTPEEYNSGHLKDAINIDFYSSDFKFELNKLDKEKKYLIYCRSGTRSSYALSTFEELQFKEVYELENGIIFYNNFE